MNKQIEIDGNDGVFLCFREKDRLTFYGLDGTMYGTIDEHTALLEFRGNTMTKFLGFSEFPNLTKNPYIGGFEPELPPIPPDNQTGGYYLHILPCIDELADLWLCDESITNFDETKEQFQLMTHSLTYNELAAKLFLNSGDDTLSKCNYQIRDKDGKVWVKMTQKKGAIAGQWGGTCGNNHPRKEDIAGLTKDCKVFLPKNTYYVDYEVTGNTPITAWVHQPDTAPGENRDIFKGDITGALTVEINESKFNGTHAKNAVKINGNYY